MPCIKDFRRAARNSFRSWSKRSKPVIRILRATRCEFGNYRALSHWSFSFRHSRSKTWRRQRCSTMSERFTRSLRRCCGRSRGSLTRKRRSCRPMPRRARNWSGSSRSFAADIQHAVRHHHERWDGQGYPDGITSSAIPLASRIILIADTIDAMTTDRPYRKRLSLEIVIAELQKCRGTQFDPSIVDVAVSSVAVRRLIAGPTGSAEDERAAGSAFASSQSSLRCILEDEAGIVLPR